MLFSDGYMDVKYAILMAGEQTTEEFQREDLQGKKIGAADTLQGETMAEEVSQETATVYEKEGDAVNALEKGEIDALILDEKAARYFCCQSENLYICDSISDGQSFVITASAEDEELRTDINDALSTMKETGD